MPALPAGFKETASLIIDNELSDILARWLQEQAPPKKALNLEGNYEMVGPVVAMNCQLEDLVAWSAGAMEARMVRTKLPGRKPWGAHALRDVAPGHLVSLFPGRLSRPDSLPSSLPRGSNDSQALFFHLPKVAVDAHLWGLPAPRLIRRSCRPNLEVKLITLPASKHLQVGLFAKQAIWAGEELCLPLGLPLGTETTFTSHYDAPIPVPPSRLTLAIDGTRYPLDHVCACGQSDLCLGPAQVVPPSLQPPTPVYQPHASSNLPGGGLQQRPRQASAPSTVSSSSGQSSAAAMLAAAAAGGAKLSREERKMLQYIEYFERMESAEANKRKRAHSVHPHVGGGDEAAAAGSGGGSSSGKASPPKPPRRRSSSSGKVAPDSPDREQQPTTASPSGRSPHAAAAAAHASSSPSSPLSPHHPQLGGHKGNSPRRTIFNPQPMGETLATAPVDRKEFDRGKNSKKATLKKTTAKAKKQTQLKKKDAEEEAEADEAAFLRAPTPVDVEGLVGVAAHHHQVQEEAAGHEVLAHRHHFHEPFLPPSSRATPLSQTMPDDPVAAMEQSPTTPSRKRVSLTDYLKKKRSTPQHSEEAKHEEEIEDLKPEQKAGGLTLEGGDPELEREREREGEREDPVRIKHEDDPLVSIKVEDRVDDDRFRPVGALEIKEEPFYSLDHPSVTRPAADRWAEEAEQGEILSHRPTSNDHGHHSRHQRSQSHYRNGPHHYNHHHSHSHPLPHPHPHAHHHAHAHHQRGWHPSERRPPYPRDGYHRPDPWDTRELGRDLPPPSRDYRDVRGDPRDFDPRLDSRLDPRGDHRGDLRGDIRGDSRSDVRGDPRLDPRTDSRLDPRGDPRLDPRTDPRLDPRGDPRGDPSSARDPREYPPPSWYRRR